MKSFAALAALLLCSVAFAGFEPTLAKPEARKQITAEAFLYVAPTTAWDDKSRSITLHDQLPEPGDWSYPEHTLAFATDDVYREARRLDGVLVRVEGFEVRVGWNRYLLAESVREVVR